MVLLRSWWLRFAIAFVLAASLLVPRLTTGRAVGWSLCLAFLAATGIGLIRLSRRELADMKLVQRSDEVTSPRDGERVAVCGVIETDEEPLPSPVRRRPSVLYHYSIVHSEPGGPTSDVRKDITDFAGYGAVPSSVRGPRFSARLGDFPTLHDFGTTAIQTEAAPDNVREWIRWARFEPSPRGTIEWVHVGEDLWDGRSRLVRDFRLTGGHPVDRCRFNETSVSPGDRVCAVGFWSAERNALVAGKGQPLWLYRGTKETVREVLSSSVGCGRFLGMAMIAGAVAGALYLAGLF